MSDQQTKPSSEYSDYWNTLDRELGLSGPSSPAESLQRGLTGSPIGATSAVSPGLRDQPVMRPQLPSVRLSGSWLTVRSLYANPRVAHFVATSDRESYCGATPLANVGSDLRPDRMCFRCMLVLYRDGFLKVVPA